MRARFFVSVLSVALFCPMWALSEELVLSGPPKNLALSVSALRAKFGNKAVRAQSLFSSSEQAALGEMGEEALKNTLRVEVDSDGALEFIKRWSLKTQHPINAETNAVPMRLEESAVHSKQWGLQNDGKGIPLVISDYRTDFLPGIAGEDIGFNRAPPPREPQADLKKRVVVAVLDTGIEAAHPDLQGQLRFKESECEAQRQYDACLKKNKKDPKASAAECDAKWAAADTDGNGYPRDCLGWNLTAKYKSPSKIWGDEKTQDLKGHGTHIAGVIGAYTSEDRISVQGVINNVLILPVKILSGAPNDPIKPKALEAVRRTPQDPSPNESDLKWSNGLVDIFARGLLYAVREGAQVVNLSLAWPSGVDSLTLRKMVEIAQKKGVLIVASAGNDHTNAPVFPCSYEGVICVGAHGPSGEPTYFTNFGPRVDVAAPGQRILSTWPLSSSLTPKNFRDLPGYEYKNGTSMAAPFVVGALARLLDEGYPPEEARMRLLSATRQSRPVDGADIGLFTQTGNIDLAQGLSVRPHPWIELVSPSTKMAKQIQWDGIAPQIPLTIDLKNSWASFIGQGEITLTGYEGGYINIPQEIMRPRLKFTQSIWNITNWAAGASQNLKTEFDVPADGIVALELEVRLGEGQRAAQKIRFELDLTKTPSSQSGAQRLSIDGAERAFEVRTLQSQNPVGDPEYLFFTPLGADQTRMELVVPTRKDSEVKPKGYRSAARMQNKSNQGILLQAYQLGDRYALIYKNAAQSGRVPRFSFEILNSDLSLALKWDYDNVVSAINDRFQWLGEGTDFWPAWVGWGTTPPAEAAPYDPWNPNPLDPMDIRFYVSFAEGLRSVPAPDGYFYLNLINPTPADRIAGAVPVLLGKGNGSEMEYATAVVTLEVSGGKSVPQISKPIPVVLERYRSLLRTFDVKPVVSMGSEHGVGSLFLGSGVRGSLQATLLTRGGRESSTAGIAPVLELAPQGGADSVMNVLGAFSDGSVFSETHHDIQFHSPHLLASRVLKASLRRFSFLPAFNSSMGFFPVRVLLGRSGVVEPIPALLSPEYSGGWGREVVVPHVEDLESGRAWLERPLSLKLSASPESGCEEVGNLVDPGPDQPMEFVYYCGDHFLRVPLVAARGAKGG